ncbi:MAG: hypothetical protein ACRBDL_09630 [Alphaproteobacteria bacterium]
MHDQTSSDSHALSLPLTAAILILFIGFWSTLYLNALMNMDVGWLLQCLDRFLSGGTYSENFYETNPPLSFLIYLPAYPLYSYLEWDALHAIMTIFLFYIGLSTLAMVGLLRQLNLTRDSIILIISGYLIVDTWAAGMSFGQRDHLVFTFLIPLCLYQYLSTMQKPIPTWLSALSIILGGIAICLKPYYGLVTALLFVHRLYKTRSLSQCIVSKDFLGLVIIGGSYIAFVATTTPDFLSVILPEVLSLYSIDKPYPLSSRFFYIGYAVVATAFAYFLKKETITGQNIRICVFILTGFSILCFIPYLLQNKGFHYHAFPSMAFGMLALFLSTYNVITEIIKKPNTALVIACIIISSLTYSVTIGKTTSQFLTAKQYLKTPLIASITDNAWNGTFTVYDFKSTFTALPFLSGLNNGSRFGQLWPLYNLSLLHGMVKTEEERDQVKKDMMAVVDLLVEDIEKQPPSVIAIPRYPDPATQKETDAFLTFLRTHQQFDENLKNYHFEGTKKYNRCLHNDNSDAECILSYDVYVLEQPQQNIEKSNRGDL